MSISPNWKDQTLTLEQWKANCQASSHLRPGDKLSFKPSTVLDGVINCYIEGTSVFVGAYFCESNTGWNHD